jgi:hypothetical protein
MAIDSGAAARWFTRVVWLGIVANLALAVPTLFAPARMMVLIGFPVAEPLLWAQFSALLLILLSAFYVPAALSPSRYYLVAWLAVGARLVGFVFFVLFQPAAYRMLGYFDLVFFIPEVVLLLKIPSPAGTGGSVPMQDAATWSRR